MICKDNLCYLVIDHSVPALRFLYKLRRIDELAELAYSSLTPLFENTFARHYSHNKICTESRHTHDNLREVGVMQ